MTAVSGGLRFVLRSTPVNLRELRRRWLSGGALGELRYRPLELDLAGSRRLLRELPVDDVADAGLAGLLREKRDELERKLTMLGELGSPRYREGSLQLYGGVDAATLAAAEALLAAAPRDPAAPGAGAVSAARLQALARAEIAHYRAQDPSFAAEVELRADLGAGAVCSNGRLLLNAHPTTPAHRVEALLQHEVGVHLVTFYNGLAQPLGVFARGLAGCVELQEGLAVVAELLAGGLDGPRLRVLAGRIVAVRALLDGAALGETIGLLAETHGFPRETAFDVACRVHRGGGLTKDVVYLRGLLAVLRYLGEGGDLAPLLVGKVALRHVPVVQGLLERGALRPPRFRPRVSETPQGAATWARLRRGVDLAALVRLASAGGEGRSAG